jgi:hypothetical protein
MTKIICPKCKNHPTGKYRDEMSIDGMHCRPCNIAWNVDWENQKQLYHTAIKLDDGSGDRERKLTSSEMKTFLKKGLPKIMRHIKTKNNDNDEK